MAYRGHQETPRALGTSLSSPLRCPGWAASARESHCHLVGKARIASTLPRGTAGSKPPPSNIPGPAGEQDLEKSPSTLVWREEGSAGSPHLPVLEATGIIPIFPCPRPPLLPRLTGMRGYCHPGQLPGCSHSGLMEGKNSLPACQHLSCPASTVLVPG